MTVCGERRKRQEGAGIFNDLIFNKPTYQKGGNFYRNYSAPYYYSSHYRLSSGGGIGQVFAKLGRYLIPIVKQGIQALKEPVKGYIASKSGELIEKVAERGINKLQAMQQRGEGVERRRKRKQSTGKVKRKIVKRKKRINRRKTLRRTQSKKDFIGAIKHKAARRRKINKRSTKQNFSEIFENA